MGDKLRPLYKKEKSQKYGEPHLGKNIRRLSCHSKYDEYTEGQVVRDHNGLKQPPSLELNWIARPHSNKNFQIRVD